jgi:hypothetical protein
MLPSHIAEYQEEAIFAYLEMSENGSHSLIDAADINRYLSALYFSELRFLHLWHRQCYLAPFIAEAVKAGAHCMGRSGLTDSPFIFNPATERR